MSLFFSQTMSGRGFPMAFTANSTKLPSLTLIFFSFSMNWGRTKFSFAVTHKMSFYTMFHTIESRSNTVGKKKKKTVYLQQ